MKILIKLTFTILLFLSLSSCFTLHKPSYLVSTNDAVMPAGTAQVQVDVSRNYVLGFGGANKKPMMAQARAALSNKYGGFLPYSLNNISVDEAKTSYFFVFYRHELIISANMILTAEEFSAATNKVVEEVEKYGFTKGDRVYFNFKDSYGNYKLSGTISGFVNRLANIDLDENSKEKQPHLKLSYTYVALKELRLMTKEKTDYKQGDFVNFIPRGFNGSPFYGMVEDFYSNTSVKLKLASEDLERWKSYGGKVDAKGFIYVPTYRVFYHK